MEQQVFFLVFGSYFAPWIRLFLRIWIQDANMLPCTDSMTSQTKNSSICRKINENSNSSICRKINENSNSRICGKILKTYEGRRLHEKTQHLPKKETWIQHFLNFFLPPSFIINFFSKPTHTLKRFLKHFLLKFYSNLIISMRLTLYPWTSCF